MSLNQRLHKRIKDGSFRTLNLRSPKLIDFSSNDYLGLARSTTLKNRIANTYADLDTLNGATGSRLLSGNTSRHIKLEEQLAHFFGFEASTLFSSGYMANMALFSSVPQKGDTVIYDELSHACIKDGLRLSFAKRLPFKHNDIGDLKTKIKSAKGRIYIVCESVYSMDGDIAPLKELADLANEMRANLIVDEAHSTGIWGEHGQGLVHELDLNHSVFAVIHTFGKGMGIHGATISGSSELRQFITNFARPFIYTTAPSDHELISIEEAFKFLKEQPNRQANLFYKIALFNRMLGKSASPSAIKTVILKGNEQTKSISKELFSLGFDVRPILSPTVKEGTERLRICLHTFNTDEQIKELAAHLKRLMNKA